MKLSCLSILILLIAMIEVTAQRSSFRNPSFEDEPQHSKVPQGWFNCGAVNENPPDILPDLTFQVMRPPYAGRTYLGMVTRDNGTWEAIGGNLTTPLLKGTCYRFSLALCHTEGYFSVGRLASEASNYNAPVVLRIWGAFDGCELRELLAQSPTITHTDWRQYTFVVKPQRNDYSSIVLEVFYPDDTVNATNGNLLLDAASAFELLPNCEVETIPQNSSEVVKITGKTTDRSALDDVPAAPEEEEFIVLDLPGDSFFTGEEALRGFAANTLNDLSFNSWHEMTVGEFMLRNDPNLRNGHPAWFALQYGLQYAPVNTSWELVVYHDDPVGQDLRVLELGKHLTNASAKINISPYQAEVHDGVSWFCMSVANGLYLLRKE